MVLTSLDLSPHGRGAHEGAGVKVMINSAGDFEFASYVRDSSSDASASKKPRPNITLTTPYFDFPSPQFSNIYKASEVSVYQLREKSSLATITTMLW